MTMDIGIVLREHIYSKNNGYHIWYVEKGKVRERRITLKKETVLLYMLNIVSFDVAMNHAKRKQKRNIHRNNS